MIARRLRNANIAVALDALSIPLVRRVHLKDDVRSLSHRAGLLGQKLVVERERKVAGVLGGILVFHVESTVNSARGHMSHTLSLVEFAVFRARKVVTKLAHADVLEDPRALLWQQHLEHDVRVLRSEASGRHDLTDDRDSMVQLLHLASLCITRYFIGSLARRLRCTQETGAHEVFAQLKLLLDEFGYAEHF